jgi:1-acyl-sn-glycerol-3-phosphate acyltransferase
VKKVQTELADDSLASRGTYQFARVLCWAVSHLWMRTTIEGKEHIPKSGPFILAPTHRSYMDTPISAMCARRRMRYMGKDSLWNRPWKAWICTAIGGFPVSRGSADREAIARSLDRLQAGEPLVLFPEGERKAGPLVEPLKDGAMYLASKAQVVTIPVGIGGSQEALPKGKKMLRPVRVHVVIGAPIAPVPLNDKGAPSRTLLREGTEQLHASLQALFDQANTKAGVK